MNHGERGFHESLVVQYGRISLTLSSVIVTTVLCMNRNHDAPQINFTTSKGRRGRINNLALPIPRYIFLSWGGQMPFFEMERPSAGFTGFSSSSSALVQPSDHLLHLSNSGHSKMCFFPPPFGTSKRDMMDSRIDLTVVETVCICPAKFRNP